jgi:hypothetical protein
VPLDDGGRLDQHHHLQTARPQSVEPDPEQAVDRDQSEPTRPLVTKNVQLVTEGKVLQAQNHPTTESAGNDRDDGTHEFEHAGNTTAAHPETLDFSTLREFLAATAVHPLSPPGRNDILTQMPSQTFPDATFDIQEREIPRILNIFSQFLGKERLRRRIELAEKMLAGASPTYGALFVRPKQFLWLGTRNLFEFINQGRSSRDFLSRWPQQHTTSQAFESRSK